MPLRGIQNAAHGLSYYSRLQEVVANNLANASTDAFKVDRHDGPHARPATRTRCRWSTSTSGRAPSARPAVRSTWHSTARVPRRQYAAGRAADAAADRSGSTPSGQLTDADGNPVLGEQGPIMPGIGTVEMQPDGTVLVDGAPLDEPAHRDHGGSVDAPEGRHRTVHPSRGRQADGRPTPRSVRQGQVEEPNSDAVLGMIDLVTIQRAYAANVDALKAMDGVLGTIASEVGRV